MGMVHDIAEACSLILTASAIIMGGLYYVVILPLRTAIDRLAETISRLEKAVSDMEARQRELAERVTIVEQTARSAHKRLDELVKGRET